MRVAYLGPPGTVSHEALRDSPIAARWEAVSVTTLYEAVMAVQSGNVARALVPIENSVEGTVNPTLDTLALDADSVIIIGEMVHTFELCLVARAGIDAQEIATVISHPQPLAQSARFLRRELPQAGTLSATSTSEAVRLVAESDQPWAALGTSLAADLNGLVVLRRDIADQDVNQTRFVWLAPAGTKPDIKATAGWKTSIVFWGDGDTVSGWLVGCLSEFGDRGVNLSMIESRPRRSKLGHYMFFADLSGEADDPAVADGLEALRQQTEMVRVLGSYPIHSYPST
ncbi:MAG: prephenate dehydratase [Solirubrobacterales bacterium]|nr:prephenate dehydratase [Solirubrobacterales bacterium]